MNRHIKSLIDFLDDSPCNFYAVDTARRILTDNGFIELSLTDNWQLEPRGKYFTIKNDSAIFAFTLGEAPMCDTGVRIIAAHSDSPCFRIKPHPVMASEGGIVKLNTEVYGGPILYTWFDRPLSVAGRVILRGTDALHPVTKLLKIDRPLLVIPHLPIHFNRSVNEGNPLSKQKDMLPMLGRITEMAEKENLLTSVIANELNVEPADILDFDLMLYDTHKAAITGLGGEFICSGRIDDLSMVHAAITAIIEGSGSQATRIAAIFDNEETGSGTKQGAASPILANIIKRINLSQGGTHEDFLRGIEKSFMISADNAHAFHPNYPEKFDPTNHPAICGGPVIKINANCKYMTDAHSSAIFAALCEEAGSPCQRFVNHSDVAGGSTLGNILTSQIDIEGVDVGNALWAMHSVCETGSTEDHINMIKVFTHFFN